MQLHRILSTTLLAAALLGAPAATSAEPVATATQTTPARAAQPVDDAARYAEREKQSPETATFEGGGSGIYLGGGALTIIIVVLLLVIIF